MGTTAYEKDNSSFMIAILPMLNLYSAFGRKNSSSLEVKP